MNNSNDNFSLYKGKGLQTKHYKTDGKKTFVFDLDETIGSFSDLYILFKCIENIQKENELTIYDSDEILLFCLLDEFPEFFRYGISVLFKYLNDKKKLFSDINVYIYTNNICIPITVCGLENPKSRCVNRTRILQLQEHLKIHLLFHLASFIDIFQCL